MSREMKHLPIGVFDSGVGGISVLKEAVRILPEEDFYFVGDCANAPYGTRPLEQIRALTLQNVARMREHGIKAIVIACNTATSAAITQLREIYTDIPVIGIEPALKPAVHLGENPTVVVMATPGTVAGDKFQLLKERFEAEAHVIPLGCPGLMEFVEQGILEGAALETYLHDLLDDILKEPVDGIVLGCTHYPFVRKAIQKVAGDRVHVLDGSEGTARELKRRLGQMQLLTDKTAPGQVVFDMTLPGREPLCRKLLES